MTKAYASFLSEPVAYALSSYGDTTALCFRGSRAAITLAHNLFCNLDSSRKLTWVPERARGDDEVAFISLPLHRIKSAVRLYLYLRILMGREVSVSERWDEETGGYELIQDEEGANVLAETDAQHFMANLQTETFLPAHRSYAA